MTTQPQFRAVPERRVLDNIGLDAALIGAVDTSVLLWDLAAFVNNGAVRGAAPAGTWPAFQTVPDARNFWAVELNAANPAPGTGTTVKLTRRGQYVVTLSIQATAASVWGISLDAPAATLLAANAPLNTQAGIRQGMEATAMPVTLSVEIAISDALAGDALRGIVRFHGTLPSEGGPITTGEVTPATARYTIAYVGDLMGS